MSTNKSAKVQGSDLSSLYDSSGMLDANLYPNLYALLGIYNPRDPLRPPSLVQSLDRSAFLALLNDHESAKPSIFFPPGHPPPPQTSEILREWIDDWLDTGRNKNGGDDPRERNLEKAEKANRAAWDYSQRGKISLLPASGGLGLWLKAEPDGKATSPIRRLGWTPESHAREKLVFFLFTDLRHKLAKCRKENCGIYFVLKRWNKVYKRGTLCGACQRSRSLESAVRATSNERNSARRTLYRLAVKKFAKQILPDPQWYRNPKLKTEIASYLNAQIKLTDSLRSVYLSGTRNGITGKWLAHSRNWQGIRRKALEENRNAKG